MGNRNGGRGWGGGKGMEGGGNNTTRVLYYIKDISYGEKNCTRSTYLITSAREI